MTGAETRPLVRLADGVMCQPAGDEAVLLDLDRGSYYALNEVAARMLALARALGSRDAVVGALVEEYEACEDVLRADLESLLSDLQAHGLLSAGGGMVRDPSEPDPP